MRYSAWAFARAPVKALPQLVLRAASNPEELQPVQQEAGYYRLDSLPSRREARISTGGWLSCQLPTLTPPEPMTDLEI